jgi:hypothetical protein
VFVSHLIYWSDKTDDPNGWTYKTLDDWWAETALGRYQLKTIRNALIARKLIEEKLCGQSARLYYKIAWNTLQIALAKAVQTHQEGMSKRGAPANQYVAQPQTGMWHSHKQDGGDATDKHEALPQTPYRSESTTENTTKTNGSRPPAKRLVRRGSREASSSFSLALPLEQEKTPASATVTPSPESGSATPSLGLDTPEKAEQATLESFPHRGNGSRPIVTPLDGDDLADKLTTKFGLSDAQRKKVKLHIAQGEDGRAYVLQCEEIADSKPRENSCRAFMAAFRDGWKKPVSSIKPKPPGPRQAEPDPQELPLSFEERISRLATLKAEVKDV